MDFLGHLAYRAGARRSLLRGGGALLPTDDAAALGDDGLGSDQRVAGQRQPNDPDPQFLRFWLRRAARRRGCTWEQLAWSLRATPEGLEELGWLPAPVSVGECDALAGRIGASSRRLSLLLREEALD